MNAQTNEIRAAVIESILTSSIVKLEVAYHVDFLSVLNYLSLFSPHDDDAENLDTATENDGSTDVWGTWAGDDFRLKVKILNP